MIILDGRKLSEKILNKIKKEIQSRHLKLTLAVILVGDNKASEVYIKRKKLACEKVGINFKLFQFSKKINEADLSKEIKKIVMSRVISGIIIQLPLPKSIDSQKILNLAPIKKDVDILSEEGLSQFNKGKSKILPTVVSSVDHFLKEYKISLKDKKIIVVGAGRLVGKPVTQWLLNKKTKVLMINKLVKNAPALIKMADIIISGVGKANLITGSMVKKGAVVIDAGISVENGSVKGDVEFQSVFKKVSYITPVPGGVGPLTVACLIENLVILNKPFLTKAKTDNRIC